MELTLDHLKTFPHSCFARELYFLATWSSKSMKWIQCETEVCITVFTRNPAESCSEPPVQVVSTQRLHGFLEIKYNFKKPTNSTNQWNDLFTPFPRPNNVTFMLCFENQKPSEQVGCWFRRRGSVMALKRQWKQFFRCRRWGRCGYRFLFCLRELIRWGFFNQSS